jgi:branched-chain amino acid transport system substrate-binding protein
MVSNFARITRVAALCLAASLVGEAVQAADPVKIGFAGPMTGPVSAFGNEIKRGIDMAIAAVNAKGGV